jgi:chemotaxis regulatin CheY-phosphate phosphatase CheZ
MSTEQERINAVTDAITFENGHYISDDRRQVAEAAIAAADATREVTDANVKAGIESFKNWDETFFEQLDEVDAEELVRYIQQAALKVKQA